MSIDNLHPLDKVTRFGFAHHGVATNIQGGRASLLVDGVSFPLPFEWPFFSGELSEPYDTHLLKVPGLPEIDLSPEEVAAEKAKGRTWQNYALISESRLVLFGNVLRGWVCIDSTGERWLVRATPVIEMRTFDSTQPLNLDLSFVRFGHLDEAAETPTPLIVTLDDVGQSEGTAPPSATIDPNLLMLRVGSISSDGRKAVLEIHGVYSGALSSTIRENTAPAGFLMLELSGDGPGFTASLTVLRTRAQVLGAYEERRTEPEFCLMDVTWSSVATPRTIEGVPGADVVATLSGATYEIVPFAFGSSRPLLGSGWVGDTRTDRVAALIFDDANQLVEFTYDAKRRCDYNYPDFDTTSITGAVSGWIADSASTAAGSGAAAIVVERISSELIDCEIVIKRDGVAVVTGSFTLERTLNEGRTVALSNDLRRVSGQVIGPAPDPNWNLESYHNYTTTFTVDEGAGEVSWDLAPWSDTAPYTRGLWSAFTSTGVGYLQAYGTTIDYTVDTSYPHGGARIALHRLSNNLFGASVLAKAGTLPNRMRMPAIAAPQAMWVNPDATDTTTTGNNRAASYHPYTHQIFTSANDVVVPRPFVWV